MSVTDFGGGPAPAQLEAERAMGRKSPAPQPTQARSRRTMEKLFDAAEAVFLREGFAGATVAQLAAEAGVSVGAFYGRFADKQAFLEAFFDRSFEHSRVGIDPAELAAQSDGTPTGKVRAYVANRVAHYRDRRELLLAVQAWLASSGGSGSYARRRGELADHAVLTMLDLAGGPMMRDGVPMDEARRRAAFCVWLVAVGANDAALRGDARNGSLRFAERPLIESLTASAMGVLGLPMEGRGLAPFPTPAATPE